MPRKHDPAAQPIRPLVAPFTERLTRQQQRVGALSGLMTTLQRTEDFLNLLGVSADDQHAAFAPMAALIDRILGEQERADD